MHAYSLAFRTWLSSVSSLDLFHKQNPSVVGGLNNSHASPYLIYVFLILIYGFNYFKVHIIHIDHHILPFLGNYIEQNWKLGSDSHNDILNTN